MPVSSTPSPSHAPVLLAEILAATAGARRVVDGTLGHGGHAERFLTSGARVLGIDRDPDAVRIATARLARFGNLLTALEGNAYAPATLGAVAAFHPNAVLLDLGVSSRQLDVDGRGFTFRPGAPLDMRMGGAGRTAADLLNEADVGTLATIFREYGDERRGRRLAAEIAHRRAHAPFVISDDLVNAIRRVLGPTSGPADFARLFQAVRIAVNDELDGLAAALPALRDALMPSGILAVISYHSGEDRIVKQAFHEWSRSCVCPSEFPICQCRGLAFGEARPRRPILPGVAETSANPRARSAHLRLFRTADAA